MFFKCLVLPFSWRGNTEKNFDLILLSSADDECFQIVILFLVKVQCISSSLKNRITEHYPDSQVISQQESIPIDICCTLSINIVNARFDHRYSARQFCKLGYKMLARPINLSLCYYAKDNVVLQALCPSSNCLYTKSKSTMLGLLKSELRYKLSTSKWSNSDSSSSGFLLSN